MSEHHGWYLTSPWDPVPVRRGDALGLRPAADYFAELLAPGLSNSTSDARWISLLSWCLKWSHVVWEHAGGADLSRRDAQRARYAWLRPLELLWIARTLVSDQTTGQLRGRRSLKRWLGSLDDPHPLPNFAMTADQFRRYRQVGTYGAYRVVLRSVPGLTTGDGWTPGATGLALANVVNDSLPRGARLKEQYFENGTKWGRWSGGDEARYWVDRGWQAAREHLGGFLPTPDGRADQRLPSEERRLLEPVLFAADSTRWVTVQVLASAKTARTHVELCHALASSAELSKKLAPASLAPLPAFTHFADAAMHAMRGLWSEINYDDAKQAPPVDKLVRSDKLRSSLDQLREASVAWLDAPARSAFAHEHVATQLAGVMSNATTPIEQLRALAQHHYENGGGRRWFRERDGKLVPLVADTGIVASDYRFRLRSLCRLAAQCGVANMNHTLDAIGQRELDDEENETL